MSGRYRDVPPRASALLESLRGLGYSTATALADILDNSITAGASRIDISFVWCGAESRVAIIDNGRGMDEEELSRAMRLGDSSPLDKRSSGDLGRFGLGLKTASFSQCRRLTVASVRHGSMSSFYWDLDILAVADAGQWRLMEGPPDSARELLDQLKVPASGTIVLWEHMDHIVTDGFTEQDFLDLIDRVERHIAMVFHRFIDRDPECVEIRINEIPVKPWDPFLQSHPATWRSPVESIPAAASLVEVQSFVLPHKDRLDARTYDLAAGPDGWTAQQGFYVYRNHRMLVAGSWLGLGSRRSWIKEESHRLARLRLDITNQADMAWKIDVRKSTARPPVQIRERLMRLAEDTRSRARRVFAHRGQPVSSQGTPITTAWTVDRSSSGFRYRIDLNHPAIRMVMEESGELRTVISTMLRVIEETVPVQRIWLDTAESKDTPSTGFFGSPAAEVVKVMTAVYRNLVIRKNMSPQLARQQLCLTEPFNQYRDLVAQLPDDPDKA